MGFEQEDCEEVSNEVFARRSQARQRQITIGKSRPEYKLYASAVPFHRRTEHTPHTPDPHARISKRAFDRELACWRRGLHVWSGHIEGGSSGPSPKALRGQDSGEQLSEEHLKWADISPANDWSPAGTESTRADSEASSPTRAQTAAAQAAADAKLWNVKLNLFEHLSPPLPVQACGTSTPAMPQMLPAVPATAPWEFPAAFNNMSMAGMPMVQLSPADQQQQPCPYTMPCAWGEPLPPWAHQSQPAMTLAQQASPLMQPSDSMAGAEMHMSQSLMWQSSGPQQALPGTPRSSKANVNGHSINQAEDAPRTPAHQCRGFSATSPGPVSPWLRTPSPDHAHYKMQQFNASQQANQAIQMQMPIHHEVPIMQIQQEVPMMPMHQEVPSMPMQQEVSIPAEAETDPWATATLMVATRSYFAEGDGYLSVAVASPVRAMLENPHGADGKCAWPSYVYCLQGQSMGWVPQQILWRCYVDDAGRRWASDGGHPVGSWCWVDEMDMNN